MLPEDIFNIKTAAPFFASALVLSFQGQAPRPPPCSTLLHQEQEYLVWDPPSPDWFEIWALKDEISAFWILRDIQFLACPSLK